MYNHNFNFLFYLKLLILCNFIHLVDYNSNYESELSNKKILKILQKQDISSKIINFIGENLSFKGKFKYKYNSDDLECMFYHEPKNNDLYIVFNGTEFEFNVDFLKDASTFLHLEQNKFNNHIKIHSGYYDILYKDKIIYKIINLIKNNTYTNIYLTGHSSGGGLATICSYILTQKFPKINFNLIVFASIKVGNKYFIKYLEKCTNIKITSIINSHDLVPILPPLQSYCSFDNIIKIGKKINYNTNINLFNNYSIPDHYTKNYIIETYNYIINKKN